MKNAVFRYSPAVTKRLNVPKSYKGFVPFCFRLNENSIDKTKKLEVEGHNFVTVKCYSAF